MKTLDSKFLRKTLSKYSTGVTVVTSTDNDGNPLGMTVNSFTTCISLMVYRQKTT